MIFVFLCQTFPPQEIKAMHTTVVKKKTVHRKQYILI